LSDALKAKTGDLDDANFSLVKGLGAMAVWMAPDQSVQAMRLLATVAEATKRAEATNVYAGSRTADFWNLLQGLEPGDAMRLARRLALSIRQERDSTIRWWLSAGLCLAAEKIDPRQTGEVCGPVFAHMVEAVMTRKALGKTEYNEYLIDGFTAAANGVDSTQGAQAAKLLADAMERETNRPFRGVLAQALASVFGRLEPARAAQVYEHAARVLSATLERPTDVHAARAWKGYLSVVASRMEPARVPQVYEQAARALTAALERETDPLARYTLAHARASMAARMEPAEAARALAVAFHGETSPDTRKTLAQALSLVAVRLEPGEAARVCGLAARELATRLELEKAPHPRIASAEALAIVSNQMDPADASRVCDGAIRRVLRARTGEQHDRFTRFVLDGMVVTLLPQLDPRTTHLRALELTTLVLAEGNANESNRPIQWWKWEGLGGVMVREDGLLKALLDDRNRTEVGRRAAFAAAAIVQRATGQFATLAPLAAEPFPCR
jgi:hypothetical protein